MTRFARAKGSKSSNERTPEDSTPWEVMKEQLLQAKTDGEESKKRRQAEQQRIENYENFLKEHKVQKRKATWCEFPENENKKAKQSERPSKNKKKKKQKKHEGAVQSTLDIENLNDNVEITSPKKSKKKQKSIKTAKNIQEEQNQTSQLEPVVEISVPEPKSSKKDLKKILKDSQMIQSQSEPGDKNDQQLDKPNKKKNNKNKKLKIFPETGVALEQNCDNVNAKKINNNPNKNKKNKAKLIDGEPLRRKPIDDRSFQLIINGKDVELVRFDGFPIMKKDAERLQELKSNMIKKGIPKSEVNRTLKLERRRAEKALARLKRDVCYNCRKGGHNLSDCPELKTKIPGVGAADGVCFKCGSTEHKQFECKVQKDKEFRFATCFICKEPGHIARQCPDNPKGLYPNGGSCKLCGDVTHLRKDCPTAIDKKEGSAIILQTLESTENLEGIEDTRNTTVSKATNKNPKKIKF